jgi:hypothetical protein
MVVVTHIHITREDVNTIASDLKFRKKNNFPLTSAEMLADKIIEILLKENRTFVRVKK